MKSAPPLHSATHARNTRALLVRAGHASAPAVCAHLPHEVAPRGLRTMTERTAAPPPLSRTARPQDDDKGLGAAADAAAHARYEGRLAYARRRARGSLSRPPWRQSHASSAAVSAVLAAIMATAQRMLPAYDAVESRSQPMPLQQAPPPLPALLLVLLPRGCCATAPPAAQTCAGAAHRAQHVRLRRCPRRQPRQLCRQSPRSAGAQCIETQLDKRARRRHFYMAILTAASRCVLLCFNSARQAPCNGCADLAAADARLLN
ncbi:hypothetical protein JKP88DRAFT_244482 [Tribonema minus]|uniref:Uncharacterized protein n=1 Tax=Tribonema minus TaxID=303371 RepID=A0A836CFS1_9STRA|nr:hypothetical protein JKP88DRAFT_244482 [Tribonema minus]